MIFKTLVDFHKAGALKVANSPEPNKNKAIVGGVALNDNQCKAIAQRQLGWNGRISNNGWELIKFTDQFIKAALTNVENLEILNESDIQFESIRLQNSEKIMHRIVISTPTGMVLTIIKGGPGYGGAYAFFNSHVSHAVAEYASNSYKSIFEYIVNSGYLG